jgi:hypothetical protein
MSKQVNFGATPGSYKSGETFSDVLAWNHFGTETIPPRPVLRIAAERTDPKNKDHIKAFLHNLITNPKDSERLETVLLTTLGQQVVAEAKRMIDGVDGLQPNAPATIKQKGFNKPLYENGDLEKHLDYEITEE